MVTLSEPVKLTEPVIENSVRRHLAKISPWRHFRFARKRVRAATIRYVVLKTLCRIQRANLPSNNRPNANVIVY